MSLATACLGFFLTLPPRNALHSMHTKSLKLQPSSSSSAKGHTGKHEERARNHEDLLALWVAFKAEAMHQPTSCTLSMFQSLSMVALFQNSTVGTLLLKTLKLNQRRQLSIRSAD